MAHALSTCNFVPSSMLLCSISAQVSLSFFTLSLRSTSVFTHVSFSSLNLSLSDSQTLLYSVMSTSSFCNNVTHCQRQYILHFTLHKHISCLTCSAFIAISNALIVFSNSSYWTRKTNNIDIYGIWHGKLTFFRRVLWCAVADSCKQPLGKPQTFRAECVHKHPQIT